MEVIVGHMLRDDSTDSELPVIRGVQVENQLARILIRFPL